jgi:hypothetical protein
MFCCRAAVSVLPGVKDFMGIFARFFHKNGKAMAQQFYNESCLRLPSVSQDANISD